MTLLRPPTLKLRRDYERVMLPKLIYLEDNMIVHEKDGEGV